MAENLTNVHLWMAENLTDVRLWMAENYALLAGVAPNGVFPNT